MEITLHIDLQDAELDELRRIEGKRFMSADAIAGGLRRLIRRQLGEPAITVGTVFSVTYCEDDPDTGRRHVFHRNHRPTLCWDGHGLHTRGGSFRVTELNGITELKGAHRGKPIRRAS